MHYSKENVEKFLAQKRAKAQTDFSDCFDSAEEYEQWQAENRAERRAEEGAMAAIMGAGYWD